MRKLTLCLSDEDCQAMWRRAALARLPVAAYVRQAALRPAAPPRSMPVITVRSYGQFGRMRRIWGEAGLPELPWAEQD